MDSAVHSKPSAGERGQSLVEFAVVSIPLLLLLLAILQFAFIYSAQVGLTNGVRDVARFGSTLVANDDASASVAATATATRLKSDLGKYVTPYSPSLLATGSRACYDPTTDPGGGPSARVTVTAVYDHPLLVPIISQILQAFSSGPAGSFRLTSTIELRVDNPLTPVPSLTKSSCAAPP